MIILIKKLIFCLFLFAAVFYANLHEFSDIEIDGKVKRAPLLVAPPLAMKHFTFGYDDVIADLMWVRVLQDLGFCEKVTADTPIKEKKMHDGKDNDSLATIKIYEGPEYDHHGPCRFGWGYNMLNFILEVSPRFYAPAASGPLVLGIVTSDIEGAGLLFDKALKNFPNDWPLYYRAGYHFMFEQKDYSKAAGIYYKAAQLGAPDWVNMLAARLHTVSGRTEVARRVLLDYRKSVKDKQELVERIDKKLKEIDKIEQESKN